MTANSQFVVAEDTVVAEVVFVILDARQMKQCTAPIANATTLAVPNMTVFYVQTMASADVMANAFAILDGEDRLANALTMI